MKKYFIQGGMNLRNHGKPETYGGKVRKHIKSSEKIEKATFDQRKPWQKFRHCVQCPSLSLSVFGLHCLTVIFLAFGPPFSI